MFFLNLLYDYDAGPKPDDCLGQCMIEVPKDGETAKDGQFKLVESLSEKSSESKNDLGTFVVGEARRPDRLNCWADNLMKQDLFGSADPYSVSEKLLVFSKNSNSQCVF